jgi:hypothetical protein
MATALAAILAALFAAVATVLAAVQARRANSATVDVRILKYLQDDVVQLQVRVSELRRGLHESQNETDEERRLRRRVEGELIGVQDLAQRMARALVAAGIPIPEAPGLPALGPPPGGPGP